MAKKAGGSAFSSLSSITSGQQSDLLKRVKQLHADLAALDQDADTSELDTFADQLAQPKTLLNKDKAFKAYVGCCIVDVLRLYAPEAPYTQSQLSDLFQFLFRQLKNLGGAKQDPHHAEYFYILESLASVKSIVLLCDVDGADDLAVDLFTQCFDSLGPDSPKNIEILMSDMLTQLVEEFQVMPADLTQIILDQFTPSNIKSKPASYRLATSILSSTASTMSRHVAHHFGDLLVSSVHRRERAGTPDSDDEDAGPVASLEGTHDLVRELDRALPDPERGQLLMNVYPLIVQELRHESVKVRQAGVQVLASILAKPATLFAAGSKKGEKRGEDGEEESIKTLKEWLGRSRDTAAVVRVETAKGFLGVWKASVTGSGGAASGSRKSSSSSSKSHIALLFETTLEKLLTDTDANVRLALLEGTFGDQLDFEFVLRHVDRNVLKKGVAERTKDSNKKVRKAALKALGRLWSFALTSIEDGEEDVTRKFGWIPETILGPLSINDPALKPAIMSEVTDTMLTYILPVPHVFSESSGSQSQAAGGAGASQSQAKKKGRVSSTQASQSQSGLFTADDDVATSEEWVDRLLLVIGSLKTDVARNALAHIFRLRRQTIFHEYIYSCEAYNGGIGRSGDLDAAAGKKKGKKAEEDTAADSKKELEQVKDRLKRLVQVIANLISDDPNRAADDLHKFAKANESQLYRLFKALMDSQVDLKTIQKNWQLCMKRTDNLINSHVAETMSIFLKSSAFLFVNKSSIPTLLKRATADVDDADAANEVDEDVVMGTPGEKKKAATPKKTAQQAAIWLLEHIAKARPELLRSHLAEVSKTLRADSGSEDAKDAIIHGVARLLKTVKSVEIDSKLSQYAVDLAGADARTVRQAACAATIVALDAARPDAAPELVDTLADLASQQQSGTELPNVKVLAGLSRLARHAREAFRTREEDVVALVTSYMNEYVESEQADDAEDEEAPDWVADADLDPRAESLLMSVKLLSNRALAMAADKTQTPVTLSKDKGIVYLFTLIGELLQKHRSGIDVPSVVSRTRLAASYALLKVAVEPLVPLVHQQAYALALVAQDPCYEVRSGMISRLIACLRAFKIRSPRFTMITFLVAYDPEDEIKTDVKRFVAAQYRRLPVEVRSVQFEHILARLLHFLAHHPDFSEDAEEEDIIPSMAKYIEFYLESLATSENISLLYHIAGRTKGVRDAWAEDRSDNLYTLSEVTQVMLNQISSERKWPKQEVPAAVMTMPSDVFKPLESKAAADLIRSKVYLSDSIKRTLEASTKGMKALNRPKPKPAPKEKKARKKATPPPKKEKAAKRGKAKKGGDSDDDDDEDFEGTGEVTSGGKRGAAGRENKRQGLRKLASPKKKPVDEDDDEDEEEEDNDTEEEDAMDEDEPAPAPAPAKAQPKSRFKPGATSKTPIYPQDDDDSDAAPPPPKVSPGKRSRPAEKKAKDPSPAADDSGTDYDEPAEEQPKAKKAKASKPASKTTKAAPKATKTTKAKAASPASETDYDSPEPDPASKKGKKPARGNKK